MGLLALIQSRIWCIECGGGLGKVVMLIFWLLILILLAFLAWFFYRILKSPGRPRGGPGVGTEGPPPPGPDTGAGPGEDGS
jgi:hypothetical protein